MHPSSQPHAWFFEFFDFPGSPGNFSRILRRLTAVAEELGTLSIDDVGCHGRSPEVIFYLSSAIAMDTPSVPNERSRRQRRITYFDVLEKTQK